ncbi:MAG: hypothetical protein FWD57_09300, partial [Polyangiaceae bacterium]|nr:hypothetical protein [Polyangiaceae bacterium]
MTTSSRRSLYPVFLILLANTLILILAVAYSIYAVFASGASFDFAHAGVSGWTCIALTVLGFGVIALIGTVFRSVRWMPALLLGLSAPIVAAIGLFGTQYGVSRTMVVVERSGADAAAHRLVGTSLFENLHPSVIGSYAAVALLLAAALTVAFRHWPSRGAFSSGARIGLFGGVLMLLALIVVSFFYRHLGEFGPPVWIATFVGLVAIAVSAHAIRNDPTDAANMQAAGELWVTMLLSLGATVFAISAGHTLQLAKGLSTYLDTNTTPQLAVVADSWTNASDALLLSAGYLLPLIFAAIASMLSREALGSWGLRKAGVSFLFVPLFFLIPTKLQYLQTYHIAGIIAESGVCKSIISQNDDLDIPVALPSGDTFCGDSAVEIGRSQIRFGGKMVGATSDLDSHEGCVRVAALAIETPELANAAFAVDRSVSYARAACFADAMCKANLYVAKSNLYWQQNGGKGDRVGSLVPWITSEKPPTSRQFHCPFGKLAFPMHAMLLGCPADKTAVQAMDQLLIHESGFEYTPVSNGDSLRFDGSPEQGVEQLRGHLGDGIANLVVAIQPSGTAKMGDVLQYAALF